jgi:hypothetical protein
MASGGQAELSKIERAFSAAASTCADPRQEKQVCFAGK